MAYHPRSRPDVSDWAIRDTTLNTTKHAWNETMFGPFRYLTKLGAPIGPEAENLTKTRLTNPPTTTSFRPGRSSSRWLRIPSYLILMR
jgi:hypothetical protein